jgi:hypothetical protein
MDETRPLSKQSQATATVDDDGKKERKKEDFSAFTL